MKQTNKMRRALTAALFCGSLFMLGSMTSCSKDAVNEETPLATKGRPGGDGTKESPYLSGNCPFIDFHLGSGYTYFSMDKKKCSFRTINPSNQKAMVITLDVRSGQKSFKFLMQRYPSLNTLAGGDLSFSTHNGTVELRIPPVPCGPNEDPNPVLPAEEVLITIEGSEVYDIGVKFTYK